MKSYTLLLVSILLALSGCGGDGGDESNVPNTSTVNSNPDCDETHEIPETGDGSTTEVASSQDSSSEPEGCELSPICKSAVAKFEAQGYVVKRVFVRNGKIIIDINTCGGDANVNINSGNSTNPAPSTE